MRMVPRLLDTVRLLLRGNRVRFVGVRFVVVHISFLEKWYTNSILLPTPSPPCLEYCQRKVTPAVYGLRA
jgi:hypothetical protein